MNNRFNNCLDRVKQHRPKSMSFDKAMGEIHAEYDDASLAQNAYFDVVCLDADAVCVGKVLAVYTDEEDES